MFNIELTPEAIEDLRGLRDYDQRRVVAAFEAQLAHGADRETRNRKRLRPNRLADWELRVGDFRVFYDIAHVDAVVRIVAIGYKQGGKLFVHGEEYDL